MSSCLILQDKNNFYIGADTACSVNINGKYYRYSDNIEKIFTHGNDIYFCSGNMTIVNSVNLWIATRFCDQKYIDIKLLSDLLKKYYPKLYEFLITKTELGEYIMKTKLGINENQLSLLDDNMKSRVEQTFKIRPCFFEDFK